MFKNEQRFNDQLTGQGFSDLKSKCFYDQNGNILFLRFFSQQLIQGQGNKASNLLDELKSTRTVAQTFEFFVLKKQKILQLFKFFDTLNTQNQYAPKFDLSKFIEIENPLQSEEE